MMKSTIALSSIGLIIAGSVVSCFSWAQDQNTLTRTTNGNSNTVRGRDSSSGGAPSPLTTYSQSTSLTGAYSQAAATYNQADGSLNNEVAKLLQKYSSSTAENDKKEAIALLGEAVAKQFDAKQEVKLQELQKLEEQLVKLKEIHAKREQQKDRIVNDRVQQLILEADGLGWGSSEGSRAWGGVGYTVAPFGAATVAAPARNSSDIAPNATSPATGQGRAFSRSGSEAGQAQSIPPR